MSMLEENQSVENRYVCCCRFMVKNLAEVGENASSYPEKSKIRPDRKYDRKGFNPRLDEERWGPSQDTSGSLQQTHCK